MIGFKSFFLPAFVLMAVCTYWQNDELQQSKKHLAALSQSLQEKDREIETLHQQEERNQKLSATLRSRMETAYETLRLSQQQLEREKYESHAFQEWANTALPAAILRLHDHPPLKGSASYRALSPSGRLPDGREPSQNQ